MQVKGDVYMFFDEMQLKVFYEMKKEEMEKALLASRNSKNSKRTNLYRNFLNLFKKNKKQNSNKFKILKRVAQIIYR